ncbi:hypothetical protein BDV33DRAFT_68001 [Aspergillus novoparasiticus]|uniref:Uncharacterized protein n=1 Tax=Aspergillus novoparasiticus TaxID=986946 RepID=A0A5N6EZU8_9EURO|nr:hypothetical protein BDV33DRAFT_68001 [Aspergillus novoparasiticus]
MTPSRAFLRLFTLIPKSFLDRLLSVAKEEQQSHIATKTSNDITLKTPNHHPRGVPSRNERTENPDSRSGDPRFLESLAELFASGISFHLINFSAPEDIGFPLRRTERIPSFFCVLEPGRFWNLFGWYRIPLRVRRPKIMAPRLASPTTDQGSVRPF